jgi:hypothetical protein
MEDSQMVSSARQIAVAIETLGEKHHLDRDDRVALATMALTEFLAQHLGPLGCIARLRTVADSLEGEIGRTFS